jgi:hypothetical protein
MVVQNNRLEFNGAGYPALRMIQVDQINGGMLAFEHQNFKDLSRRGYTIDRRRINMLFHVSPTDRIGLGIMSRSTKPGQSLR